MLQWSALLNSARFSELLGRQKPSGQPDAPDFAASQFRNPIERDHDRVLFSTPFRRMGDKTQVFPLESIESIRTRLTHSYEVANLARSLGTEIAEASTVICQTTLSGPCPWLLPQQA
jgi:dGTPase